MEEVPLVAAILAHHPGWESFALVVVPIIVIAAALAVVKRRVDAGHGMIDVNDTDETDDTDDAVDADDVNDTDDVNDVSSR